MVAQDDFYDSLIPFSMFFRSSKSDPKNIQMIEYLLKFGLFTQKYKWLGGMGGVLANFFKKITLNFLTSGAEVRLFTNMFLKIDLRFDFFAQKYVW